MEERFITTVIYLNMHILCININTFLESLKSIYDFLIMIMPTSEIVIGVPTLIFTVSIPLAFFVFDQIKEDGYSWDIMVILTKVINIKSFFLALAIYFISLLGWNITILRFFLTPILILCNIVFIKAAINIYKWLTTIEVMGTTFRNEQRLSFISDLGLRQSINILSNILESKKEKTYLDKRDLINVYIKKLDILFEKELREDIIFLINQINKNIERIDLGNYEVHIMLIDLIFKWGFKTSTEKMKIPSLKLEDLLAEIIKYDIDNNNTDILFENIRTQLVAHRSLTDSVATFTVRHILNTPDNILSKFEWEDLPSEWTINYDKLMQNDSTSIKVLNIYISWILFRKLLFTENSFKIDEIAEYATKTLLPEVDPVTWSDLLIFFCAPFGYESEETRLKSRVLNFIENFKAFGYTGKVYTYFDNADQYQQDYQKYIDESFKIFAKTNITNKNEIINLIAEIDRLKEDNSYINIIDDLRNLESLLKKLLEYYP